MRIPRSTIGQIVMIIWRDPTSMKRLPIDKAPKGLDALATWREYGRIDDITNGVVRLIQSDVSDPPGEPNPGPLDITPSYIPEALIDDCVVMSDARSVKDSAKYNIEEEKGGTE